MDGFHGLFGTVQDVNSWQMIARALLVLCYGLLLVRVAGRRIFARSSPLDLALVVVLGSSLSRALTANAPLLPTLAAVTAMVATYWLITFMTVVSDRFRYLVKGRPVRLITEGQLERRAMRFHGFTEQDIEEAMRKHGIAHLDQVRSAQMEDDGRISFLTRE